MRGPLPRPLPSLIPKNPQPEPWLELGGSVWGPGGQFRVGCGRAVPCWVRAGGSASAGGGWFRAGCGRAALCLFVGLGCPASFEPWPSLLQFTKVPNLVLPWDVFRPRLRTSGRRRCWPQWCRG